jgi:hypothetical protein
LATTAFLSPATVFVSATTAFVSATTLYASALAGSASTGTISAVSPGARPRGFETVAPCGPDGVEGVASVVPACGSPSGFATVAPCVGGAVVLGPGLEAVEAVVDVEDVPSGFATVAPCVELATGFALEVVADAAAGVPRGLDTVAPWGAGDGTLAGATVADRTFAVMLADPAEPGLDPEGAGAPVTGIVAGALATAGAAPAALELETTTALVLGVVAAIVAGAVSFEVVPGAMFTAIEAGALPFVEGAGLAVAVDCTVSAGDDGLAPGFTLPWVPAAFCAFGTVPAPGVPIPGNTVPCCRLPSFG